MSDLAREYFLRELTEAEEERLSVEMASFPEASQAFIEAARLSYEATGLPDPLPPGASAAGSALKGLLFMMIVLASVVGLIGWALYRAATAPPLSTTVAAPTEVAAGGTVQALSPLPPAVVVPTDRSVKAAPVFGRERYEDLGVVVRMASPGEVAVRVLDVHGREVRRLFKGVLPSGEREFIWDRQWQDGTDAKSGFYRIEVIRGGKSMVKEVQLTY